VLKYLNNKGKRINYIDSTSRIDVEKSKKESIGIIPLDTFRCGGGIQRGGGILWWWLGAW
jgi:hypothetical protein